MGGGGGGGYNQCTLLYIFKGEMHKLISQWTYCAFHQKINECYDFGLCAPIINFPTSIN